MQEYFATVALLRLRCLSFELCVFKFASFLVLNISCKKQLWQLAFYASVTGLDFFVIRWCCLASVWGVGPVSDYQLLCMKHLPITSGLSLPAVVYKSILLRLLF